MFLDTPRKLRSVVHSLLSEPFKFEATGSFSLFDNGNFLEYRSDKSAFIEMCKVYDEHRMKLASQIPILFFDLPYKYNFKLTDFDSEVDVISYFIDGGESDYPFNVTQYLKVNSVSRQLDRLYDLFSITTCGKDNPLGSKLISEIVKFLIFNELLSLAVAGKLKVAKEGREFQFTLKDSYQRKALRRYLFANSMAGESSKANMFYFDMLSKTQCSLDNKSVFALGELILNKELFINKSLLSKKSMSLKSTQYIISVINLISALLIAKIKGTPLEFNKSNIESLGIPYWHIRDFLVRQKRSLITEQFVNEKKGILHLEIESWASNLSGHLKNVVEEFGEGDLAKQLIGGIFFEINYIKKVLETQPEYSDRFIVATGFDRNQVKGEVKNESDVDVILFDTQLKHYYFLQIKYALEGNTPYFNGAVKRLQSDLASGIKQLSEAKRLQESGELDKTLKSKGFVHPTEGSSSFILLHNLPDYDYQCTDYGVALYDWNSFRNLILDFRIFVTNDTIHKEVRGDYKAPLNEPDRVISKFLSDHPVLKGKSKQIFLVENSKLEFCLGENIIVAEGVGL